MSAGTGVTHSEFNPSKTELVQLLQIWILPEARGIKPSYEQKEFDRTKCAARCGSSLHENPDNGAVKIHQDLRLFATVLDGETVKYST